MAAIELRDRAGNCFFILGTGTGTAADPFVLGAAAGGGTLDDFSGTSSTGASAKVLDANPSRRYLLFQNVSDTDMWINLGDSASPGVCSLLIAANGGTFVMEGSFVSTEALYVYCSGEKEFTLKEG